MGGERFFTETNGYEDLPTEIRTHGMSKNTVVLCSAESNEPDQDLDAVAEIIEARSTRSCAYAIVDMTATNDLILRGKRGILLSENRSLAVVQDELTLTDLANVIWNAYTPAKVISASARTLVLELNGKRLLCKLSGAGNGRFTVTPVEGTDLKRITVQATANGKFRMAVACRLLADGESRSQKLYDLRPMSTWNQ